MLLANRNPTFDELVIGDSASTNWTLTRDSLSAMATIVGAGGSIGESDWSDHSGAADGAWLGTLVALTLSQKLPGAGIGWLVQTLRFHEPVEIGDSIAVTVTVTEKARAGWRVLLDCIATNQHGQVVASGSTEAMVPPRQGP